MAKLDPDEFRKAFNFQQNVKIVCKKRGYLVKKLMKAAGTYESACGAYRNGRAKLQDAVLEKTSEILDIPKEILISDQLPEQYLICTRPERTRKRRPAAIEDDKNHTVKNSICNKCIYRSADSMPWRCDFIDFTGKCRRVGDYNHCPEFTKGQRLNTPQVFSVKG